MEEKETVFAIPAEIYVFFDQFVKDLDNITLGSYGSLTGKSKIQVIDLPNASVQVGMNTGTIRIDINFIKNNLQKKDFIWFMLIWATVGFTESDTMKTDKIALEMALKEKKNMIEISDGFFTTFNPNPKDNYSRENHLESIVKKDKNG